MSLKTKTYGTVVTLAIAAVGMYFLGNLPKTKPKIRNGHMASVTAIWLPSPRHTDGVHIWVTVGGSLKVDRVFTVAPYHQSWPIESGQRVEIRVRLLGTQVAATMGCAASIDELPSHTEAKEGPKAGDQVTCWAVA